SEQHEGSPSIGVGRLLAGGLFVAFTAFLGAGLLGRPLGEVDAFLPPHTYPGEEGRTQTTGMGNRGDEPKWFSSYEDGLEEANATNRPIFVDFTGFTCTNCRWMEANVFSRNDIQELFGNYVLIRLYTDGQGDKYTRNRDLQFKRFGTIAMPLYVILTPLGENLSTLAGLTRNKEKFASFLRAPLAKQQASRFSSFSPQ
ncbi:MAG: thioredoxin family protein, partial [Planctomycetota bacterium]|nr:thioredoxin family protein [Planctomycetota bacterium]